MKLVVVAQVYNEVETGNIGRFLDSVEKYADGLIIYDDGSTDGTKKYLGEWWWGNKCNWNCTSVGYTEGFDPPRIDPDNIYMLGSPVNDFKNEMFHKQQMLERALKLNPDWILWLDADEVVEPRGELGDLRKLMENTEVDGWAFHQINLWRTDRYYRIDNQYNDGIFVRLWRNNGKLRFEPREGLHQRPYPEGVQKVADSDIQIIHYGFASNEAIIRKYKTYKTHGQEGWALNRLVDEDALSLRETKQDWFRESKKGPGLEVFNSRISELIV